MVGFSKILLLSALPVHASCKSLVMQALIVSGDRSVVAANICKLQACCMAPISAMLSLRCQHPAAVPRAVQAASNAMPLTSL